VSQREHRESVWQNAARRRKGRSVMEEAIARAGVRKGFKACTFIAAWAVFIREWEQSHTEAPLLDDYAAYWGENRSTSFRDQQQFRAVFPEFATPSEVLDMARSARVSVSLPPDLAKVPWSGTLAAS
jgi:hypothetical protein